MPCAEILYIIVLCSQNLAPDVLFTPRLISSDLQEYGRLSSTVVHVETIQVLPFKLSHVRNYNSHDDHLLRLLYNKIIVSHQPAASNFC